VSPQALMEKSGSLTMEIKDNFIRESLLLKLKQHVLSGLLFPKETAVE